MGRSLTCVKWRVERRECERGGLVVVPKEFYPEVTRQQVWAQELRGHPDWVPAAGQTNSPRLASSQANSPGQQCQERWGPGLQHEGDHGPSREGATKRHPCSSADISLPSGLCSVFHNSADVGSPRKSKTRAIPAPTLGLVLSFPGHRESGAYHRLAGPFFVFISHL